LSRRCDRGAAQLAGGLHAGRWGGLIVRKPERLSLEQLAPWLLTVPDPLTALDWRAVFAHDQPVEIEVGFGKGLFLTTEVPARPGTNFLGVEIERKYQLFTATRLAKRNLANVKVACADAKTFLPSCVADGSVEVVHVYFPDPWWKRRHQKR